MQPSPATTVVVVTWRGADHIAACLDAVAAQQRPHATLVVDNASDDGTSEIVATHPSRLRVLRLDRNTGYAGALAAALSHVDTRYMAWLNDDTQPDPGWLAELEDALAADPKAAAVSARLERDNGEVQSYGVGLTPLGYGYDHVQPEAEVFGFCGGAALLRADALRAVGGVPAEFFCYYEDTDTAWRFRLAGWTVRSVPSAGVRHLHGASTRPGSPDFHRWNERNRLLTLLRCAPLLIALREHVRFGLITLLLPLRRTVPEAPNFDVCLRRGVLGEVLRALPSTLLARKRIGRSSVVDRSAVWREWAGR